MLKLVNIKKDYVLKGVETVHALKGLTLNFRRNEFVAILGPSGCGKTTFLNIIGGLDRYSEGDLIIEGKSTKEFGDRDWDTYRNHSIGFVFQSYNLIMHQTVLKNVELALTISGVKKAERRERALEVLKKVGLEGYEKKKPNQLSGGQMQRVAIARSLINNPEILLADEPTGALDTETSIQIMDLLKEVAQDRLVIMVTHNPDLATRYATRIVSMLDGLVVGDTNPYEGESIEERNKAHEKDEVTKGSKKKSSMSFATATGLSFSNLLSKLRRTILVSIAGSIGIIGVSAVLSVSYGVRHYIDSMQSDMLSAYPLNISETNVDYTSLMAGLSDWGDAGIVNFDINTSVGLDSMINYLMDKYKDITSVKTNEINYELLDYIEHAPEGSVSAIDYDYGFDMTNNIFTRWQRHEDSEQELVSLNGLTQMYISELKTVNGFSEYAMFVDLFTNFMKQLPADHDYIMKQYDLIGNGSRFPQADNELVLVVDSNQTMTDFLLAQLGYYSEDQFLNIAKRAIEENKENPDPEVIDKLDYPTSFTFDEILGKELAYYPHDTIWDYQEIVRTYVRTSFDIMGYEFAFNVYYHEVSDTLEGKLVVNNKTSLDLIMSRQAASPDPSIPYLGTWMFSFGDLSFPFTISADGNVYYQSPVFDENGNLIGVDMKSQPYETEVKTISGYMYPGFAKETDWADSKKDMKIVGILKPKKDLRFGTLSRGIYYTKDFTNLMIEDSRNSQIVNNNTHGIKKHIMDYLTTYEDDIETYEAYVTYPYTSYSDSEHPKIVSDGMASALNIGGLSSLASMFSITGTSKFDLDTSYLRCLSGLATKKIANEAGSVVDYQFKELPRQIALYPENFAAKDKLTKHLDAWNKEGDITVFEGTSEEKVLTLEDRDELTYEDRIGIIINVVNTLITSITIALVVFTSLALVVSCFMIAVITYISTMERVKEIGVIRSLGGRKLDVSRLFVAECLIIGLSSGVIGVAMTYLIDLIINIIVTPFGVSNIAILTFWTAIIMIGLSIVLNVLSGLIPSMRASRQDPVKALRTE